MADRKGKILYVCKAGNLRNRVRSYFVKGGDERPSIQYLMRRVDTIRTILTETEKEALILENNLIKQHKPTYNVDLRDDKSFFSLRLNVSHPFPRLTLVRTQRIQPDRERYFGPYASARDARITLKFILKLFPLRQCTERHMAGCKRPCLNCQMGRCMCPCSGKVDPREYAAMVQGVILLLQGRSEDLKKNLLADMHKASEELRFEEAARIRDRLAAVERTLEAQHVSFFHLKDQDVVAIIAGEDNLFAVEVLSFRKGKLLSGDSFLFRNPALEEEEILASCVKQYYTSAAYVPKEILLSKPIEQPEVIEAWLSELRGSRVILRVPVRARRHAPAAVGPEERAQRVAQGEASRHPGQGPGTRRGQASSGKNSAAHRGIRYFKYFRLRSGRSEGLFQGRSTGQKSIPRHTRWKDSAIRTIRACILQTVSRRIGHADEEPLPDLPPHRRRQIALNAAAEALKKLPPDRAPGLAGIAKAREEVDEERFYLLNRKNPVLFPKGDSGLMLLMRVRDEAHRFAHTFHTPYPRSGSTTLRTGRRARYRPGETHCAAYGLR